MPSLTPWQSCNTTALLSSRHFPFASRTGRLPLPTSASQRRRGDWHAATSTQRPTWQARTRPLVKRAEGIRDLNRKVLTGKPFVKRSGGSPDGPRAASEPNSGLPRRQLTNWCERRALELSGKVESTPANYCKLWRLQCVEPVSLFTVLFRENLLRTQNLRASDHAHTAHALVGKIYFIYTYNTDIHTQTRQKHNMIWHNVAHFLVAHM